MSRIGPSLRPLIVRPQTASVIGALDVGGAQTQPALAVAAALL